MFYPLGLVFLLSLFPPGHISCPLPPPLFPQFKYVPCLRLLRIEAMGKLKGIGVDRITANPHQQFPYIGFSAFLSTLYLLGQV